MYGVVIGCLLIALKVGEIGPFATWSWWIVLAPFALAAVWWQFADSTGLTKKREIDKMEAKKQERRDKALDALGLDRKRDRQVRKAREVAKRNEEALHGREERAEPPAPRRDPRI